MTHSLFVCLLLAGSVGLLLWVGKGWLRKQLGSLKKKEPLTVVRQLSEHQQFLLRSQIPTPQLELFDEVLLVSLGFLHDLLSTLSSSSPSHATRFEEKLATLTALLKRVRQHPLFLNQTVTERSRNNALLVFVFYRVLYEGVLDKALAECVLSADTDPFILLKRIPAKVSTFFGGQVWRLYELTTLVQGDLNALTINQDLHYSLAELLQEVIRPALRENSEPLTAPDVTATMTPSASQSAAVPVSPPLTPAPTASPAGLGQSPLVSASESLPRLLTIPTQLATPAPIQSNAVAAQSELTPTPAVEPSTVDTREVCQTPDVLYKKLTKWLQRQLARYPINRCERFFATPEHPNVIFVSDTGLSDFAKKVGQPVATIQSALQQVASHPIKSMTLKRQKDELTLQAVPVLFTVEILHPLDGQLDEVKK